MGRRRGTGDPPLVVAGVDFQRPRGRARARGAAIYNTFYFVALAVWSVAGSWSSHRFIGLIAGLLFLEWALVAGRVLGLASGVVFSEEMARRIALPLQDLCAKAGCSVPRVVVRDSVIRAAFVRRGRKKVLLVLSETFVARVNDRELRAILAHEVIHVARNDLSRVRARAWLAVLTSLVGSVAIDVAIGGGYAFPVYIAVFFVVVVAVQTGASLFNRPLERRADLDGAALSGDPASLAAALRAAHAFSEQARRRVYGQPPWRWLLAPVSWRMPTHPPMAERIAALERIAVSGAAG